MRKERKVSQISKKRQKMSLSQMRKELNNLLKMMMSGLTHIARATKEKSDHRPRSRDQYISN